MTEGTNRKCAGVLHIKYTDSTFYEQDTELILKVKGAHITDHISAYRRFLAAMGYTDDTINTYVSEV